MPDSVWVPMPICPIKKKKCSKNSREDGQGSFHKHSGDDVDNMSQHFINMILMMKTISLADLIMLMMILVLMLTMMLMS